jgi:hypothetical protein
MRPRVNDQLECVIGRTDFREAMVLLAIALGTCKLAYAVVIG